MCGIAGLFAWTGRFAPANPEGGALAREAVTRMVAALRHRGPDDEGVETVSAPGVTLVLGHTRLSIIDLSPSGHQPMADPTTGSRITFNGEIYNFRALRAEFDDPAEPWRSTSDTEVLLRVLRRDGVDALSRLRGMFGFGFWDAPNQRLLLARDRFGMKPLYLVKGDGHVAFASELRALLAAGLAEPRLDPLGLWAYLGYQSVHPPRTMIEGIEALPPSSWLSVGRDGGIGGGSFWSLLDAIEEAGPTSYADSVRRISALLLETVEEHLVSDVPVATFLSGGIDSSALVALQHRLGRKPVTFTVAFPGRPEDEARFARLVAKRFETEHTEITLSKEEISEQVPEALTAMDQPSGDGVNTYLVSRAVRKAGIKVALSGLGSDEIFAGYPSFHREAMLSRYRSVLRATPEGLKGAIAAILEMGSEVSVRCSKTAAFLRSDGSFAATYPISRQIFTTRQRCALVDPVLLAPVLEADVPYGDLFSGSRLASLSPLARTAFGELSTYMADVLLRDTDAQSMSQALEVRVPFLDHRLVEAAVGALNAMPSLPARPKALLLDAVGDALPEDVWRRPKQGFTLPMAEWMAGPLRLRTSHRKQTWAQAWTLHGLKTWSGKLSAPDAVVDGPYQVPLGTGT